MKAPLQSLKNLLESGRFSGEFLKQAHLQAVLHAKILTLLPEALRSFCLASSCRGSMLTIEWSNPAALSTARFLAPNLIRGLKNPEGWKISEVKMCIRPTGSVRISPKRRVKLPGPQTVEHLQSECLYREEDDIQMALKRLQSTLEQKRRREHPASGA